jgi:peptide methionine sulfoxide reductase msrA/msrB
MKFLKPDIESLKKNLTPIEYAVTQEEATEPAFENKFWNHFEEGIYVDVVTGQPLFSSLDKFDAGCGWPSFSKPISSQSVNFKKDFKLFHERIEVRSQKGDSHLGHLFFDGPPAEKNSKEPGSRYCINSAALKFIPLSEMEKKGYGEFLPGLLERKKNQDMIMQKNQFKATLAGGCFWGVEELFRKLKGVTSTKVGYTGGSTANPKYEDVTTGLTGHAEAIEIEYDPSVITYAEILRFFFKIHDPTTVNQQGNDRGTQYRSHIFYHDENQKIDAEKIIEEVNQLKRFPKKIVTEISKAETFYGAEDYHQDYLQKNPQGYTCHFIRK